MQDADLPKAPSAPMRSALSWGALNFAVSQIGAFIVFLVLARTLEPAVFGVFAMAVVALDLVAVQGKYALIDALVIGGNLSRARLSTAMWLSLLVCGAACLCFIAMGILAQPLLAMPDLGLIGAALSLLLLLVPIQTVMEAQLFGRLQVKSLALRNIAMTVCGGVAGVAVALGPWPIWALPAQRAAQSIAGAALMWRATRFVPIWHMDRTDAVAIARRAGGIWRNFVIAVMPRSLVQVLIGAQLGAAQLGVLRIVERFGEIVQQAIIAPLTNLIVPVLSRHDDDREGRADQAILLMRNAAALSVPAFAGLAVLAAPILDLFLGQEMTAYAPVMSAVAAAGVFTPLALMRMPILGVLKRNTELTIQLCFDVAVAFALVLLLAPYGLFAAACGLAIVAACGAAFGLWSIAKGLGAPKRRILAALGPAYVAAAVMVVCVLGIGQLIGAGRSGHLVEMTLRVAAAVGAGVISYFGFLWIFQRQWLLDVLRSLNAGGDASASIAPPDLP
jgi:O-antigen/teichoic acid export membrane protein